MGSAFTFLLALFSLVFFWSCERSEEIGIPPNQDLNLEKVSFQANAYLTQVPEFIRNDTNTANPLSGILKTGAYERPEAGRLYAEAYMNYVLDQTFMSDGTGSETDTLDWPTNATLDSVVAYFQVSGETYGEIDQPVTLKLHQLNELIPKTTRSSKTRLDFDTNTVGEARFTPQNLIGHHVGIRLSDDFVAGIDRDDLENIRNLSSQDFLNQNFGLALSVEAVDGGPAQSLLDINMDADSAFFTYYFSRDTLEVTRNYFRHVIAGYHYSYFDWENQNAEPPVDQVQPGSRIPTEKGMLQGGSGLATLVDFPGLKDWLNSQSNIHAVKAQMTLVPADEDREATYFLPASVSVAFVDDTNQMPLDYASIQPLIHNAASVNRSTKLSFFYSVADSVYHIDWTDDFNRLVLNGGRNDPKLLIHRPLSPFNTEYLIFEDPTIAGSPVKLDIYYMREPEE